MGFGHFSTGVWAGVRFGVSGINGGWEKTIRKGETGCSRVTMTVLNNTTYKHKKYIE
jgi:hypothetical protein